MRKQFIGKGKIFSREELKAIRGGTDDTTYYEGMECGRDGRICRSSADCADLLGCTLCQYYTGWPEPVGVSRCS